MRSKLGLNIVLFILTICDAKSQAKGDSLFVNNSGNHCMALIESQFHYVNSYIQNSRTPRNDKTSRKDYDEENYDSLSFYITRRFFRDSTLFEQIRNNANDISLCKYYYSNRTLKSKGFITGEFYSIGFWEYYCKEGKLDSVANCEKNYKITFCDFFKLAQNAGVVGENSKLVFDRNVKEWPFLLMYPYTAEQEQGMFRTEISYDPKCNTWEAKKYIYLKERDNHGPNFNFSLQVDSMYISRYQWPKWQ